MTRYGERVPVPALGRRGFEKLLFEVYGVAADDEPIGYHRRVWDAANEDQEPPAG